MKKFILLISSIVIFMMSLQTEAVAKKFLPYYDSAEFTPHWLEPNSKELIGFHQVSDFRFLNQLGTYTSHQDLKGKVYVASFFFTSCPGICPKMRSQLSKVQDAYIDNQQVAIISHSIQPSNDTVEVLDKYGKNNGVVAGKWHLVTGDRDEIYRIARNDYFANEDLGKYLSDKDFLHTESLVLVDKNRHIRGIYNGLNNTSVNHLIADISKLLTESN